MGENICFRLQEKTHIHIKDPFEKQVDVVKRSSSYKRIGGGMAVSRENVCISPLRSYLYELLKGGYALSHT